ncbi:MAG: CYTH domain-containing protein [Patescibacteria group bacterium]|jgi:adenylate cyclase class 2
MNIEYEATFINIDKGEMRARLKAAGAQLIKAEFLMKRVVFELPVGHEIPGAWLRVRDEGDKITMSLKVVDGDKIENQKEIQLKIDNFAEGIMFLESVGAKQKAFQESRRELWTLDNTEITIDEWPYLEPYVEVEGQSEEIVKAVSAKLGFDYSEALFCAADTLYNKKYGVPNDIINHHTPLITFAGPNPFLKY